MIIHLMREEGKDALFRKLAVRLRLLIDLSDEGAEDTDRMTVQEVAVAVALLHLLAEQIEQGPVRGDQIIGEFDAACDHLFK